MSNTLDHRSDTELIGAAQAGGFDAFGELVRRYQRDAVHIATVALGSTDGADDVAQEAFVKAHRAIGRFETGAAFRPWLFRIVTNTARNHLRHERRQSGLRTRVAVLASVPADAPDEVAAQMADRQELVAAINRLSPADRLILAYRWYHQLSEAELSTALGCRPGTVKSRLSRAMKRLRIELEVT